MDRASEVRQVFKEYHVRSGADRNDAFTNAGVRLQNLYSELSFVDALAYTGVDRSSVEVLDVGAGDGGALVSLMTSGFLYTALHGIDVVPEFVAEGRRRWPHLDLQVADATLMDFRSGQFDVVTSSGIFVQIIDDSTAGQIASEMVRVLKPGGYLIVRDWWFPRPYNALYKPLSSRRRKLLFPSQSGLMLCRRFRGPLIPPLGRFLSKYARGLYGPIHTLLPFLAAQSTWVWRKSLGS